MVEARFNEPSWYLPPDICHSTAIVKTSTYDMGISQLLIIARERDITKTKSISQTGKLEK